MRGDKLILVVAHKDRLARFGFDLIRYLVEYNGGKILVLDQSAYSPQQELVSDLLAIVTVFGARVNGLRRYRSEIKKDSSLLDKAAGKDS